MQQALKLLQYVQHDALLCICRGVQVVGLELFGFDAAQQEGQKQCMVLPREAGKDILELCSVGWAVVGRKLHAYQQYFGIGLLCTLDDLAQIVSGIRVGIAAQAIVGTQLQDHDGRIVLLQGFCDPAQSARCGFPADAGVHHAETGLCAQQFLLQQMRPTFFYCDAVTG